MKHPRTWLYIEKNRGQQVSQCGWETNQKKGKKWVRQAGWNVDWVDIEIYAVTNERPSIAIIPNHSACHPAVECGIAQQCNTIIRQSSMCVCSCGGTLTQSPTS